MGLSNRDYFRDDDDDPYGSSWDPTGGQRGPVSLPAKLAILFGVVFFLVTVVPDLVSYLGLSRGNLASFKIWTLLTYGFTAGQGSIIWLIFSCLIVYSFGLMMQQHTGRRELLCFVIAVVLFGGVAQVLFSRVGTTGPHHIIEAITLWLALRRPFEQISLFFVLSVPMWGVATVFVGLALYDAIGYQQAVAQAAVAGQDISRFFGTGMYSMLGSLLFAFMHERLRWRLSDYVGTGFSDRIREKMQERKVAARQKSSKLRVFSPEEPDENAAAEVDRILQKIHEQGESALTGKERKLLAKESKRLRNKK